MPHQVVIGLLLNCVDGARVVAQQKRWKRGPVPSVASTDIMGGLTPTPQKYDPAALTLVPNFGDRVQTT
jgi:hypothetical protein